MIFTKKKHYSNHVLCWFSFLLRFIFVFVFLFLIFISFLYIELCVPFEVVRFTKCFLFPYSFAIIGLSNEWRRSIARRINRFPVKSMEWYAETNRQIAKTFHLLFFSVFPSCFFASSFFSFSLFFFISIKWNVNEWMNILQIQWTGTHRFMQIGRQNKERSRFSYYEH